MNRLTAFRSLEDINQEQLGRLLGVSAQMVGHMENGRRSAENVDLTKLGYAQSRLDLPAMSEPLHRHRASTRASTKKRARELLRLAGEMFGELRDLTPKTPVLTLERYPRPTSLHDVEDLAAEVRCALGHEETGSIRNLTAAVERAGVCLVPIAGLEGMDGLSAWVEDVPVIGLATHIPGDRFRFTLAHELAHLLFHNTKGQSTEGEANRFAGALLIPEAEMDAAMAGELYLRDFIALKGSWGMAVSALIYRAHELGYLDDSRYRSLQIQMSQWKRSEPGTFELAPGQLLPRLVEVNGGVDAVSSRLGLNRDHVRDTVTWSHLRVAPSLRLA